jgi:hypothetical protein
MTPPSTTKDKMITPIFKHWAGESDDLFFPSTHLPHVGCEGGPER